jgi:hypothetical protein
MFQRLLAHAELGYSAQSTQRNQLWLRTSQDVGLNDFLLCILTDSKYETYPTIVGAKRFIVYNNSLKSLRPLVDRNFRCDFLAKFCCDLGAFAVCKHILSRGADDS